MLRICNSSRGCAAARLLLSTHPRRRSSLVVVSNALHGSCTAVARQQLAPGGGSVVSNTNNTNFDHATVTMNTQGEPTRMLWSSSSSLAFLGAAAAAAAAAVVSTTTTVDDRRRRHGSSVRCEAASAAVVEEDEPSNFQLMAALDAKDEMEKVRIAQIIHDLHAIASEQRGLRKYVTTVARTVTKSFRKRTRQQLKKMKSDAHPHAVGDDRISLEGVDLKHLSQADSWELIESITAGWKLDVPSLVSLVESGAEILQEEDNMIDVSQKKDETIAVVGDLHGSLKSLTHILQQVDLRSNNKNIVVFNGDFVDRGPKSLEVLLVLILLKLAYPHKVYLVRGNHEDTMVASVYGFQDQIRHMYGDRNCDAIWESLGELFASFPIAMRTKTAFIVHGGLPSTSFDLKYLQKLPKKARLALKTTVNPESPDEKILTGLMWSDPIDKPGVEIADNPRGLGVLYGATVAQEFLKRHNLHYLVRAHQMVGSGLRDLHCGDDKSVITVFSAAAYPDNLGSNKGAFLRLQPDGSYSHESYSLQDAAVSTEQVKKETIAHALENVRSMIGCSRSKLEKAFAEVQKDGMVTVEQWVQVMSTTIDCFPGMPWISLQPKLAPVSFWSKMIDVNEFLRNHSLRAHHKEDIDNSQAETLAENQEMLLTVFKFLDTDGDGTLSRNEFRTGIDLLNKRLPEERQLKNPDELFKAMDANADGEISFQEFTSGFGMA